MPLNVLFLTFTYPTPEDPGAGIFVREHARAAARHANVAIVHLHRGAPLGLQELENEPFPTIRASYPTSKLAYPLHFSGAIQAVGRLRRQGFRPDLIHAHVFLAALPPLLLRPAFRLPVVASEHWSVFLSEDPLELSPTMLAAARLALGRAAFVLPVSEALRAGMEAHGIRARYEVIPNAVDTTVFHPSGRAKESTRLLAVGGLYEAKRLDVLIEALALVREKRDVGLDVVGDGPLRGTYEALSAERGLAGSVVFHGHLPKEEVARLMRDAAAFVLTSDFETGSCVLIEAAASGLPAVATAVGATPEIVGATGGLLAERGRPDSVAARIVELLDRGDAARAGLAERARDRFGLDAVGSRLRDVYARALRGPTR